MIKTAVEIRKPYLGLVHRGTIKSVVKEIFYSFDINNAELSVSFVGDEEIRELNNQFRSTDEATDILAFPLNESNPETGVIIYGDLVISYPTATKQYAKHFNTVSDEIIYLVIHGVLHLFGFDHTTIGEKKKMFSIQNELFKQIKNDNKLLNE